MKNKILVTGGLGYIGSHTVVSLLENNFEVVIIDNLSNSKEEVLDRIEKIAGVKPTFVKLDLCDVDQLSQFFRSKEGLSIAGIIHFAAFKYVGESAENPLKYYHNNLLSLVNLLGAMETFGLTNLVFSSSCTVYGNVQEMPVNEQTPLQPVASTYGNTKKISEEIIADVVRVHKFNSIVLRYFNPIGGHPTGLLGEYPSAFTDNLMPALTQVAMGKKEKFNVYGGDYNTPDGTCVRDYIDIIDLAEAHVKAINYLFANSGATINGVYNVGTGKGFSVMEVIKAFEQATGKKIQYEIVDKRKGDVEKVFADPSLANEELGWKAQRNLEDMIHTSWKWQQSR